MQRARLWELLTLRMLLVQESLWYRGLMVAIEGEAGGNLRYQGASVSFRGPEGSSRRLRRISFVA